MGLKLKTRCLRCRFNCLRIKKSNSTRSQAILMSTTRGFCLTRQNFKLNKILTMQMSGVFWDRCIYPPTSLRRPMHPLRNQLTWIPITQRHIIILGSITGLKKICPRQNILSSKHCSWTAIMPRHTVILALFLLKKNSIINQRRIFSVLWKSIPRMNWQGKKFEHWREMGIRPVPGLMKELNWWAGESR